MIEALIDAGHHVVGSIRRVSSGDELLAEHPEWKGKLEFVVVPDYTAKGVFDSVFQDKDIDYILHVASPMYGDSRAADYDKDWLKPLIDG